MDQYTSSKDNSIWGKRGRRCVDRPFQLTRLVVPFQTMWWYSWEFLLSNCEVVACIWMNNSRSIKEQFSREHYVIYIGKTNHPSLKGLLVIITPMPFFSRHSSMWHPEWPSRCLPSSKVCALSDNCESQSKQENKSQYRNDPHSCVSNLYSCNEAWV